MDFQLSDEQQQLKKTVRDFAEREILPNVMKWDEACEFPLEHDQGTRQAGLLGTVFPTEYAGAGMGYVEYVIAIEELSRVDGSVGHYCRGAYLALLQSHLSCRQRSAEQEVRSANWLWASSWARGD